MSPRTEEQNRKIREQRLRLIHKAALAVYIDHGYNGVDMDQVAKQAGLSKGLLYYYYKTKKQLFQALFISMFEKNNRLTDSIFEKIADKHPLAQLIYYIWEILSITETDKYSIRFAMRLPFDSFAVFGPEKWQYGLEQSNKFRNNLASLLEKIFAEKGSETDPLWAADAVWSVIVTNSFSFSKMIHGEKTADSQKSLKIKIAIFRLIARFCLNGLGLDESEWSRHLDEVISENQGETK